MEISRIYAKKSFIAILLGMFVLMICVDTFGYLAADYYVQNMLPESGSQHLTGLPLKIDGWIRLCFDHFFQWVLPVSAGIFIVCSIFIWLVLRALTGRLFIGSTTKPQEASTLSAGSKDHADQRIEQERKRRIFLHMLTILQREGRLLDFFDEDLGLYEDEQIGAAVRSIQEDCKKAIKKYIDPKPIFDSPEGEIITIEPGFDMDMIKLVGKVSGDPPFKGILKHCGWKAGKSDVPRLSDLSDPGIIASAEIEVQ